MNQIPSVKNALDSAKNAADMADPPSLARTIYFVGVAICEAIAAK